jgi:hypothetical protein
MNTDQSNPHILAQDDDGHWYLVPQPRLDEFYEWAYRDAMGVELPNQKSL